MDTAGWTDADYAAEKRRRRRRARPLTTHEYRRRRTVCADCRSLVAYEDTTPTKWGTMRRCHSCAAAS